MKLQLFHGSGDVVTALEEALALAKKGELVAVAICGVGMEEGEIGVGHDIAWKKDIPVPWANLLAAVSDCQYALLSEGLPK